MLVTPQRQESTLPIDYSILQDPVALHRAQLAGMLTTDNEDFLIDDRAPGHNLIRESLLHLTIFADDLSTPTDILP